MKAQSKPTQEVLERIKTKKLQVKPRWHFTLLRTARWAGIVLIGLFAAINFSIAYFFMTSESIPMFRQLDIGYWKYMLFVMPMIWLLIFAGMIIIAYKQYHATKQGYRYRFWIVIAALISLTFIPGITLSKIGFAYKTYEFAREHVPGYKNIDMHNMFWNRPESGLLTGKIQTVEESSFELHLPRQYWIVDFSKAEFINNDQLLPGDFVRINGELTDNDKFQASTILILTPPHTRRGNKIEQ